MPVTDLAVAVRRQDRLPSQTNKGNVRYSGDEVRADIKSLKAKRRPPVGEAECREVGKIVQVRPRTRRNRDEGDYRKAYTSVRGNQLAATHNRTATAADVGREQLDQEPA